MKTILSLLTPALALLGATSAQALNVAYWNMDASTVIGKGSANKGSQAGSIGSTFYEINAGFFSEIEADVTGTEDNILLPGPIINRAVGFFRAGSAYYNGGFMMENFDFTGLSDVTVSFAYQSLNELTWDTNLEVDYRINDGSWVDFAEAEEWASGWQVAEIGFGSLLDNASDVDFRIYTVNWASVVGYLDLDNIQVNAVPEPETYGLILGAGLLGLVIVRRRFKKAA